MVVTVKLPARTSRTWSKPGARLPTRAARFRSPGRVRVRVVLRTFRCAPGAHETLFGATDVKVLAGRPSRENEAAASRPIPAPPFGGAPCLGGRRIRCRVSCWYRVHPQQVRYP